MCAFGCVERDWAKEKRGDMTTRDIGTRRPVGNIRARTARASPFPSCAARSLELDLISRHLRVSPIHNK